MPTVSRRHSGQHGRELTNTAAHSRTRLRPQGRVFHYFRKFKQTEFIQYLFLFSVGPSSNKWPRCAPHFLQTTSVLCMSCELSSRSSIFSKLAGSLNEGHPVPESNFSSDLKSSVPHPLHTYVPLSFVCTYSPLNGASVPFFRITAYSSDESFSSQSLSVISFFMRFQ